MKANKWLVYLLRCSDNSLYCGISNNLKNRLVNHNSGKGARYTRSRRPVEIVGISPKMTKSDALKLEYRIKQLPADEKLSELAREWNILQRTYKMGKIKRVGKGVYVADHNAADARHLPTNRKN